MSAKPGRNDPCHCGSGKKYKHCHLRIDEQAQLSARMSAAAQRSAQPLGSDADHQTGAGEMGLTVGESPDTFPARGASEERWDADPALLSRLRQTLKTGNSLAELMREPKLRQLFNGQETLLTYIAQSEEIQAAAETLTAYTPEFDKLCKNPAAYRRQSETLFAEAAFEPLRFTAEDLGRAFDEVGVPPLGDTSKKTGRLMRKALLFLATEERRKELELRLLLLLPDYVKRGRHLDAIMIETCAQMTAKDLEEPNPFLGRMFLYGLEAWAAEQDASRLALLQEAGYQLGPDAAPDDVEEWLHNQAADPESAARWERLLDAHPELKNTAGDFQLMIRKAADLLSREDSGRLLLGPEEIQDPWEAGILEKFQVMLEALGPVETGRKPPKARTKKVFNQVLLPAVQELTKNIFTPERIGRLVAELRAYRKELADAGDKTGAIHATAAILYIERESQPELNSFLVNVCARSVMYSDAIRRAGGLEGEQQATE